MKKISGSTFFYKKAFPIIVFMNALIILLVAIGIFKLGLTLVVVCNLVGLIIIYLNWVNNSGIKEVYELGDKLLIKENNKKIYVKISDLLEVNTKRFNQDERIYLKTKNGTEYEFNLPIRSVFSTNEHPILLDIKNRMDK